jgi:hypothetical protein
VYWSEVKPVLDATYRLLSEHDEVSPEDVIAEMGEGTDPDHVKRALAQLYREGYIGGQDIQQVDWPISIEATEKGSQEVAGWPKPGAAGGDQLELLLRLLDDKIAAPETPPEEKTRLQRVRDSLGGAGRDIIVGVLSNFIAKQTGASD